MIKSYRELSRLQTFEERFNYLKLGGVVGQETFGYDRYFNQAFYHSYGWKLFRNDVIVRDNGCDLGIIGREIFGRIIIHHINPISIDDLKHGEDCLMDMNNSISTSHATSNAIHYGNSSFLLSLPKDRQKGDTSLWIAYSRR